VSSKGNKARQRWSARPFTIVILSAAGVERSATPAESKDPYLRLVAKGRDASLRPE